MSVNVCVADAIEYRMLQSLKGTIRKLKRQKLGGLTEVETSHYLPGTFKQLCNADHFKRILYPGFSAEAIRQLPQNLVEILEWKELELDLEMYAKNAAEVLHNIKSKGAKQGDHMDSETEEVLLPQIACEALAKGIVSAVQKLNRKISSFVAKTLTPVASCTDERALRDQLDIDVIDRLLKVRYTEQYEYLGEDWIVLLRNDFARFLTNAQLSFVDETGTAVVVSTEVDSAESRFQRMCWLENDTSTSERYPAISALIEQLHALPFELNAKCGSAGLELLEPCPGTTMFIYYPAGSAQVLRLDSQKNKEGFDSGIRVTCAYHISLPNSADLVAKEAKERAQLIFKNPDSEAVQTVPIVDDMLSVHFSTEVRNGRSPDQDTAFVSVIHFVCGR